MDTTIQDADMMNLEKAINEIAELNMGTHYKET